MKTWPLSGNKRQPSKVEGRETEGKTAQMAGLDSGKKINEKWKMKQR